MKFVTKLRLGLVEAYCVENEKSTEYMIEIMKDIVGVDLDCVLEYLQNNKNIKKDVENIIDTIIKTSETII